MAVIQKIRDKSWLLLVLIGLAMLLFVVDPSTIGTGRSRKLDIVEVNGNNISYELYLMKFDNLEKFSEMQRGGQHLDENFRSQLQHQALDELVQESIMNKEYDQLGVVVHGDELYDMIEGKNVHPYIRQIFTNPNTGVLDREQLYGFLRRMNQDDGSPEKQQWLYIEDMLYKQRLQIKYNNLISKGLYANSLDAKRKHAELNTTFDVVFASKGFASVSDSSISVSESDLKDYYLLHKREYKQEPTCDIRYVTFEVLPSKEDYAEAEKRLNDLTEEFAKIDPKASKQYIGFNSDKPFDGSNYVKGQLPAKLDSFAFASNVGEITAPYFEDDSYRVAKLIAVNYLPDSVKTRQILLPISQANFAVQRQLADSLKELIEGGADFLKLAREHSVDENALSGGDLGWMDENTMTQSFGPAFRDSAFYKKAGDVFMTASQYGIQIVEITNQTRTVKKVQVGILARDVRPSSQTDQHYYNLASEFAGKYNSSEKFSSATTNGAEYMAQPAIGLRKSDVGIRGLKGSRQLVKWAFGAKEGEVSKVYQVGDNYVVAILDNAKFDPYAELEDVKNTIEIEVRKEKKAELLSQEVNKALAANQDIDGVASTLGAAANNATGVKFGSYSLGSAGSELEVIATAYAANEGLYPKAIAGENGVFAIEILNKTEATEATDLTYERNFVQRSLNAKVNYGLTNALREMAKIKDYRTDYF